MAGDDIHRQIDRGFDTAEGFVDSVTGILDLFSSKPISKAAAPTSTMTAPIRATVVEGAPARHMVVGHVTPAPGVGRTMAPLALPPVGNISLKRPFEIVECFDGEGHKIFVVTNGGGDSATCPTRAFAEQVLAAIHAKGVR
jgi:hypothetical protein